MSSRQLPRCSRIWCWLAITSAPRTLCHGVADCPNDERGVRVRRHHHNRTWGLRSVLIVREVLCLPRRHHDPPVPPLAQPVATTGCTQRGPSVAGGLSTPWQGP